MSLSHFVGDYRHQIETELRRAIGGGASALDAYYLMLTYHMGWVDGDNQALPPGQGGKRIRPLLTVLSCAAAGGEAERALPLAAGIELLHNFSLLHDDIQDNSPLRRGRPTVWKLWGAAQAINAGDALFTLAHLAVLDLGRRGLPAAIALDVMREFDQTCLALTQGQHLDMAFEQRVRVTEAEYLTMIEGKTAALVGACARLGGRVAGASAERVEHLTQYGRHLGLAFQIHDDWLGIWGDPAVTGKSVASDLEARKKSLPVVFALERSEDFVKAYARPHMEGDSVAALSQTLVEFNADRHTRDLAAGHTRQALDHLAAAELTGPAAVALSELTHQLLERAV